MSLTDFSIAAIMGDALVRDPERPPYTYAALIMQAIRSSPIQKLTLQEIYDYIRTNYEFYQKNTKDWQNSVRHVLSISKYFENVQRSPQDPGRGNYWMLTNEARNLVIGEDTGKLRQHPHDVEMIPGTIPICPEAYFLAIHAGFYYPLTNGGVMLQSPPQYLYQNGGYVPVQNMQYFPPMAVDNYQHYINSR